MTQFTKTALASVLALISAGAHSAAFQLAEVSTSGLGSAYAGNAAVIDNASVVATNPALMTKFQQTEISAGGVYVDGNINIVDGRFRGQNVTARDIIPSALIPNLYVVAPLNSRFAIGGGMNVNYGLKSEFDKTYNAGILAGKTDLRAVNYNLSGAMDLGRGFSLGLGLNAVHAKAVLERHAGITVAQNPSLVTARLKGDEWAFAWNAGLAYEINNNHRLGFAYHSPVRIGFKGRYYDERPAILGGLAGQEIDGFLKLELPAFWEVSGYHKLTEKLAVQYSYKRTDWSSFEKLEAFGREGQTLLHKDENFNDSQRIALGASYDLLDSLTLRAGVAFDESASVKSPSISIPDTDRTWYSLGATYRITPALSLDLAYAHLRGSKSTFTENQVVVVPTQNGLVPTTLSGEFKVKSSANLYGLNVNYKF